MLDRRQKLYVTTLSFFKSKHTLLLVDIQGARWGLFDREIATVSSNFDGDPILFCICPKKPFQ